MIPYYLLSRNPHHYERLARDLNQYSRINTHMLNRAPVNHPTVSVSEMISAGAYHTVNAVGRGWNRVTSIFGQ